MRLLKIAAAAPALMLATIAPAGAQMVMGGAWPPGYDPFQGFYLGVNVGGGWGDSTATRNATGFTTHDKLDVSGPIGGVQGGYNWRLYGWNPNLILGLEADFDGSGLTSNNGQTVKTIGGATVQSQVARNMEWLGTVRGRIGYNFTPQWLGFVSGGFAYSQIDASARGGVMLPSGASAAFGRARNGIQTGWTVGVGSEYAFAPQFGLVLEYLHTDLGSFSFNAPIAGVVGQRVTVDNNANILRIGVNYHFAPPPPPPAPVAAPAPPPAPPKVFIVFFDWDKDVVTPEGHAIIQQAADAYRAGAPVQLQVTGYTDRSGSPGYNQRLSERRANNVAKALAALGVPKEQMIVAGRGENDNRVPTADGVREPQNRRVEIVAP